VSPRRAALAALLVSACGTTAGGDLRFTDVTAGSGIDLVLTSGSMPSRDILEVDGGGVALFDYDQDGDLDAFFANGATLADPGSGPGSRLYANQGHGTFTDVTAKVGITLRRWAMGVAVGDYDQDGDDDLYVTCFGPDVLLANDVGKSGRFRDVTAKAGLGDPGWSTSAAFGDVDHDGDLDLYVVNYLVFDPKHPPDRKGRTFMGVPVMAGPMGLQPQPDVFYENQGNGTFKDVTRERGLSVPRDGYGLGVTMVDFDRDGWLDIFVGNDSTENFLFHNLGGGKFKEIGVSSGVASNYDGANQASMGIGIADVDGNGFPDVFTTNFSSDTNTLHLNLEGKWFEDRTSQFGLGMISRPFLGWGTAFRDFDSDGDEDLFIANGHVYPETADHPMDTEYRQLPLLFERRGARFERVEDAGPMFKTRYLGRATAFGDLDDDGDVDIVMTTLNDKVVLFRNDAPARDVVVVELRDRQGSRHPQGSVVELSSGSRVARRYISGGSFQSVDAPTAQFGVAGLDPKSLRLRVVWPDGQASDFAEVPVNRRITVRRSGDKPSSAPLSGRAPAPR